MEQAAVRPLAAALAPPAASEAQRLASAGLAAAGFAHDLSNLLTAILTGCELLAADLERDPEAAAAELEQVREAAERAARLTERMRGAAGGRCEAVSPVDLNREVAEALPLLRQIAGPRVRVVASLARRAARVRIHPGALDQVLLNIASNARDALHGGGTLTLRVQRAPVDAGGDAGSEAWLLSAEDDGCGMSPEVLERACEPLFSTKASGRGLGLANVARIAAEAGGRVELESQPGRGTRIALWLPAVA